MRRGRSKCSKFVTRRSSACSSDCSCSIWGNYPIEGQSLVTWLDILPSLLHFPNPLTSSVPFSPSPTPAPALVPNCTSPHTPDGSGLQLTRPVSLHPSWPFGNLRSRVCDLHFQLFAELCADELGTGLRLTVLSRVLLRTRALVTRLRRRPTPRQTLQPQRTIFSKINLKIQYFL